MAKNHRRWLWLGLGIVVIGLVFHNLSRSPEWRDFRWDKLWSSIVDARKEYLALVVPAVYATYLIRAIRWKCFLNPIKKASLWVLFEGQVLGFSSIYLIGRPGEFVRPAFIAKKEKVPMSAMVAVWVLERVFDSVFLIALFAAALYFEPVGPTSARGISNLARLHRGGYVMFVLTGLMVGTLVLFWLRTAALTDWTLRLFRFLPAQAATAFAHFLHSFAESLGVIRDWTALLESLVTTGLLWFLNVTIFWLVFQSLRGGLERLPWLAAVLTLFGAALGLAVQLPGVGGGYQVATILALTEIFDVRAEAATGAGLLIWIMMSFPCLALGLVLLVREGLTFRKLAAIAEEERAVVGKL
jgi:glycosyltransferase 2 family protein